MEGEMKGNNDRKIDGRKMETRQQIGGFRILNLPGINFPVKLGNGKEMKGNNDRKIYGRKMKTRQKIGGIGILNLPAINLPAKLWKGK